MATTNYRIQVLKTLQYKGGTQLISVHEKPWVSLMLCVSDSELSLIVNYTYLSKFPDGWEGDKSVEGNGQ